MMITCSSCERLTSESLTTYVLVDPPVGAKDRPRIKERWCATCYDAFLTLVRGEPAQLPPLETGQRRREPEGGSGRQIYRVDRDYKVEYEGPDRERAWQEGTIEPGATIRRRDEDYRSERPFWERWHWHSVQWIADEGGYPTPPEGF